jgi:hypothetical protein
VAKNKPTNERTRLLRALRRRRFERFRFVGWDALVARVPEGGPLPPAVRAMLAGGSPMRVCPVPGGYLYKWPRYDPVEPPEGFEVEAGGWDHEHCDACDRSIDRGGTAWLTVRGSWSQLCPYCHRQVRRLGGV